MRAKPCIGIIAVFSTLLLTISACGDDKSSSPKALPDEVADKAELKTYECNMSFIGEKVFVKKLDKYYECDGEEWFESYDQPKSKGKDSSSSSKNKSSSSAKSSSSSSKDENLKRICSEKGACDAMDKSDVGTWHFVIKDEFGKNAEYTYTASGKDLNVSIKNDDGSKDAKTYSMYNMESESGVEMAFNAAKATCEEGGGNSEIIKVCTDTYIERDSVKDERDGHVYRTVKIGDQWWMSANLSYNDSRYKAETKSASYGRFYQVAAAVDSIKLHANKKDSLDPDCGLECLIAASGTITGICPAGWHLPDTAEWHALFKSTGGNAFINKDGVYKWSNASSLKSPNDWQYGDGDHDASGKNIYGFNVLPTGCYYNVDNQNVFRYTDAFFYTSSVIYDSRADMHVASVNFTIGSDYAELQNVYSEGYSIRCVKDGKNKGWQLPKCDSDHEGTVVLDIPIHLICKGGVWYKASLYERDVYGEQCLDKDVGRTFKGHVRDTITYCCTLNGWQDLKTWSWDIPKDVRLNPAVEYDSIVDKRDGKVYKTAKKGNRIWMAENLNYSDSASTPSLLGNSWCYDNVDADCNVGGRLYRWAAAIDSVALADGENSLLDCDGDTTCLQNVKIRGICPEGWRLPNYVDWKSFGAQSIAYKTKNGWDDYSVSGGPWGPEYYSGNGTDTWGFSAIPAGIWNSKERAFTYAGSYAFFWSSSEFDADNAYALSINNSSNFIERGVSPERSLKTYGFSIRCVKD